MTQPSLFEEDETDEPWKEEWRGMPDFSQEDLTPARVINVRFRNEHDVQQFARLMDQIITPKQKSLWYPYAEFRRAAHLRYVDES